MPRDFPVLKDGDALEPWHLNVIYRELERWQRLKGAGGVRVHGQTGPGGPTVETDYEPPLFIQITGAYSLGYPWAQVLIGPGRTLVLSGVAGGPASGDPAYERQTGDQSLPVGDTVYEAKRAPGSNVLVFDGKN